MNQRVIERIIKILREDYLYAKKSVIKLQVLTAKESERCVYELRDALDHLSISVLEDTSEENAEKSLTAAEEHIRRAAVEPVE